MRNSRAIGRVFALAAVVIAAAVVAVVLLRPDGSSYEVKARFQNASQLVKGNLVQVAGTAIGEVTEIDLTPDGQAEVTLSITDDDFAPLRRGTLATVRQASLSGVANRYVDLRLPGGDARPIPEGGVLEQTETTTAVDLDQLFNTFDPETRDALRGVVRGFATQYGGRPADANRGWLYLNPSLAATSRLFEEINRDTPELRRFVDASGRLFSDLAERREDLAGLVRNLSTTTNAIGRQKEALGSALTQLPPFLRRANTTFVNLRAALDDLAPLVEESKPVARRLQPFLAELRPLTRDARPTLRDLSRLIRRSGADNDLIELARSTVPLRDIAVGDVERNGAKREGALPASTKALRASTPELATARPYAPDLTGWFDDFSHSGAYDALGGASRVSTQFNAFTLVNGQLTPIPLALRQQFFESAASLDQRDRCPGAVERGAAHKPSEDFPCSLDQQPVGE